MPEERIMREERVMRDVGIKKPHVRPSRRVPSAVRLGRLGLPEERIMREEMEIRDVGIKAARRSEP